MTPDAGGTSWRIPRLGDEIRAAGLHKPEWVIGTPQSATVAVTAGSWHRLADAASPSAAELAEDPLGRPLPRQPLP